MRSCCNKKEDNFISYHQNREREIERVRLWEGLNPEKRKEYTIKYYKTEKGHRKRLAQQKRYKEKKKLINENEKLKNDKMNLLKKIDELQHENQQLKNVIDELEKWLNKQILECSNYSKYIEKKVSELQSRSSGKTYIAGEIMKNEVAKKNWREVLDKINELKDSDIK